VIRWLYRSIVSILAYVPMSSHIRFQPAEGR
jgi:hypothetical protein